jgi:ribonucleoside-diphosphate reductase alpha chain
VLGVAMAIKNVIKRNGAVVDFDENKIANAVKKAFINVYPVQGDKELQDKALNVAELVIDRINKTGKKEMEVEEIQNIVENVLMDADATVAKAYILYRNKRAEIRLFKASLGIPEDDLKLPINSLIVLAARYLLRDSGGKIIETPGQLFRRVSIAIAEAEKEFGKTDAEIEKIAGQFFDVMVSFKFMPNSPTLMNAGTKLGQLSACFVLPVGDSIEEIFDALKYTAIIHKSGGGTGFSFSRLRPANDIVRGTSGVSSGPLSFMRIFDSATEQIKQGGKRRGANMGILRVDHPDILNFIMSKETDGALRNFNISIAITDKFMKSLNDNKGYELINPKTQKPVGVLNARAVWNLIITMAWKTGDPGIVFIDRINSSYSNPVPSYGPIESTNPCVSKNSMVFTSSGLKSAKELYEVARCAARVDKQMNILINGGIVRSAGELSYPIKIMVPTITNSEEVLFIEQNATIWHVGKKKGVRIIIDGNEITVTLEHRILTEKGWGRAGDLFINDKIANISFNKEGRKFELNFLPIKEIIAVEDDFFDFSVPEYNIYMANGFINHNCGEQPLYPYDSCNLGSINLSKMVKTIDHSYEIDWEELRTTVRIGIRFLDNVIEVNKYPIKQIEETTKAIRRVGLGVMGWADLLIKLGVKYNSNEAVMIAEKVMKVITETARKTSEELAAERGPFPEFKNSIWARLGYKPLRNSTVTTIAPTGTISIISGGASQGIEPIFSVVYMRNVKESLGSNLIEVDAEFERYALEQNFYSEELIKKLAGKTSIQDVEEVPEKIRKLFVTAHDIAPEWHVKMQAAFQKYTDNAVSKTINFTRYATPQDIENAYMMAYKLGCKGITVYRDSSKSSQVLKTIDNSQKSLKEVKNSHKDAEEASTMSSIKEQADTYVFSPVREANCPNCGTAMVAAEGCFTCPKCGYSECS